MRVEERERWTSRAYWDWMRKWGTCLYDWWRMSSQSLVKQKKKRKLSLGVSRRKYKEYLHDLLSSMRWRLLRSWGKFNQIKRRFNLVKAQQECKIHISIMTKENYIQYFLSLIWERNIEMKQKHPVKHHH